MRSFTNITYDELEVGSTATVSRRISQTEVDALALVSGDVDAFHLASNGNGLVPGTTAKAVGARGDHLRAAVAPDARARHDARVAATRLQRRDHGRRRADRHGDGPREAARQRRRAGVHRQAGRRRNRRRHRDRAGARPPHQLLGRRHAGDGPAPQRRVHAPAAPLRGAAGGELRRRASVRPRLAARSARSGATRPDRADPGRAGSEDPLGGRGARRRPHRHHDRQHRAQPRSRRARGAARAPGPGRGADEGQPAHRRDARRRRAVVDRPAHRRAA